MTGADRLLQRDDGTRLHYRVVGDGDQTVLLAHGLTSVGSLEWRYLLPLLAPGFRCLVPDLRGHGRSDHHPTAYGWDVAGDDLRALLAVEGVERPHLVGFSFGSEVLLRMAVRDPGLAASLTLIGTSTATPPELASGPRQEPPDTWPAALRAAHADSHGPDHWKVLVRLMSALWRTLPDVPESALAQLPCPTLVVMGGREMPFKLEQARRLVEVVPDARLVEVADAGHEVHIDRRELVNGEVVAHLVAARDRVRA